jgi:hypothetical protein
MLVFISRYLVSLLLVVIGGPPELVKFSQRAVVDDDNGFVVFCHPCDVILFG